MPATFRSSRIQRFAHEVGADPDRAVKELRADLDAAAGPLVEDLEGDDRHVLVTFVFIGEARSVTLYSPAGLSLGKSAEFPFLDRVFETDVWHYSVVLSRNVTTVYSFVVDDPFATVEDLNTLMAREPERYRALVFEHFAARRSDPFNPESMFPAQAALAGVSEVEPQMMDSVLTLPGVAAPSWIGKSVEHVRGSVEEHRLGSIALGNDRRLWIYTPPGYSPGGEPYPVVVLLDGMAWRTVVPTDALLNGLVAADLIPPVVSVWVDNASPMSRAIELACHPDFCDFLADELLPWLRDHRNVTTDPASVILGGASRGGLASAYAGMLRPDAFGNVLSMSGAYWWHPDDPVNEPEWLAHQFATGDVVPVRFCIAVGDLETTRLEEAPLSSMLGSNRHLRDVLIARGYDVDYREFPGGHDFASWSRSLAAGLTALLSSHRAPA